MDRLFGQPRPLAWALICLSRNGVRLMQIFLVACKDPLDFIRPYRIRRCIGNRVMISQKERSGRLLCIVRFSGAACFRRFCAIKSFYPRVSWRYRILLGIRASSPSRAFLSASYSV